MVDPGLMVDAYQLDNPVVGSFHREAPLVRNLVLRRRRCRWPGWYSVYHAPQALPVDPGRTCGAVADAGGYACFRRRRNAGTSIASAAAASAAAASPSA